MAAPIKSNLCMKVFCINTNSENCYALINDGNVLLLDAGVSKKKLLASLHNAGVSNVINSILGCLVSHIHGDHAKCVNDLVKEGIDVFGPVDVDQTIICYDGNTYEGNGFRFRVIEVPHDLGIHCFSYSIEFGGKRILYATDMSHFPDLNLPDFDLILFELNYNRNELIKSDKHYVYKQHVLAGHMEDRIAHKILMDRKQINFKRCLFIHRGPTSYAEVYKFDDRCEFIEPGRTYEF